MCGLTYVQTSSGPPRAGHFFFGLGATWLAADNGHRLEKIVQSPGETLIKSFDKLRTNGNLLIPFVVSLSNHE